jgi:formate-dependent phosphoribosylglycinamide formyltransferase (GAR transformylase)
MKMIHTEGSNAATTKVLLTDTNRWDLAARLAIGLADAGCQVSAICPAQGHALLKTRAVHRTFSYSAFRPIESLSAAIEAVDPDIIVPSCDRSVEHLHELYIRARARGAAGSKVVALIERSLGSPASYSIVSSRNELLAIAREEGVRVPNTKAIRSQEDFESWRMEESLPWVVKADGTWGGVGVRVIQSADKFDQACTELSQISRFTRAIKRLVVNRDPFLLRSWWNRLERTLVVQSYIQGRPANCTVFSWKGRVLAIIGVKVVRSDGATGPASIVRIVDNADMRFAAERIASRLGLSGFFGLDFMIEDGGDAAYLIEMNPRLAPPCYLRLGKGRDLVGALWAQLADQPLPEHPPVTQNEMIAYIPQALKNNDDILAQCFKELPQNEPELIQELLNPFPDRTVLFRLVQHFARKPASAGGFEVPMTSGHDNFKQSMRGVSGTTADTRSTHPLRKSEPVQHIFPEDHSR